MNKKQYRVPPLDKDLLYRWFHLHCFSHIYKILTSKDPKTQLAYPRFQLFKKIKLGSKNKEKQEQKKGFLKISLFLRILLTFIREIVVGGFVTMFFSSLNLLIPLMIKQFLHFMHSHHVEKDQITSTQLLIEGFVLLQLFRIIFGQHSKRLFFELAIKVESTLSLMIVKKSLTIAHDIRSKISQAQILQLQNIDLKLVFLMFQNLYIAIQAPFTILVTIYLLYLENYKYGLIGIYWFVIAFLVQRQLDSKMTHCNDTKLKLIQGRSKVNYNIIGKIRAAKLLGQQELLIQQNNDYFIAQNHDHQMFYSFATLYDISLLMLPILVIVTIALYDMNEVNPISVSQVYILLSLLGICYVPMKNFRTLSISLHDGLRSLKRIEQFLKHQDEPQNQHLKLRYNLHHGKYKPKQHRSSDQTQKLSKFNKTFQQNETILSISKHLFISNKEQTKSLLHIDLRQNIQLYRGQRLVVVGKLDSGIEALFDSLIGLTNIKTGEIVLNQRIGYLNEEKFFRNTSVYENIKFFNKDVSHEKIRTVYQQLKLDEDLKLSGGLQGNIDDEYKYNAVQLQKISLARLLCSNAEIYLLDKVFQPFNSADQLLLEEILRQKQSEGKLIILFNYPNNIFQDDDKVLIIDKGNVTEFCTYKEITEKDNQLFKKFYHLQSIQQEDALQKQKSIFSKLGSKLSLNFNQDQPMLSKKDKERINKQYGYPILVFALYLWKKYKQNQHKKISKHSIRHYIWKFFAAISFKQFIFICKFFYLNEVLIIAVAEMMHIFIHFYIGHLEEDHGQNSYAKFQNMIIVEFILTAGLAGIIWLQGQVSSQIAIIQGNTLYKNALVSLGNNKLSWFQKQYSVKIANRFNHDYEQVFIILHMFLNIYKNIIILIATIYFISESSTDLILMTLGITATYMTVYFILRPVEKKVVDCFEEFKYKYVKVLEESIGGAKHIEIHEASKAVIDNAKKAYLQFASYKIAESYTAYGEEIFCDLVSLGIFTYILNLGLQSKVEGNSKSIAQVATMLHLLVGVFDVLKTIVKDSVNFETFFKINLLPFIEIIQDKTPQIIEVEQLIEESQIKFKQQVSKLSLRKSQQKQQYHTDKTDQYKQLNTLQQQLSEIVQYSIHFNNVILHESKYHQPVFQVYPLNIYIEQGETVLFYESNQYLKNYLLYALTKNLPMFNNPQIMGLQRSTQQMINKDQTILIGQRDICCIQKAQLQKIVQILIQHDFYIQGTIEDNLSWKNHNYDKNQCMKLAQYYKLYKQLPQIKTHGLKAHIRQPSRQLIKKITFIRMLSMKPKIVIIKDTQSIIDKYLIVEQLKSYLGNVTIIKISSNIDQVFDIDRIIYTKNFMLIQDRLKKDALINPFSMIGDQLKKANINGLVFANKLSGTVLNAQQHAQPKQETNNK